MWLLFAFSGPVLWAASTHVDKYLVEKYFKHSPTAVLVVFTSVIGVVMLPFIWWLDPSVLSFSAGAIVVMVASGVFYMGSMLFYLQALQTEEASVIAPLFQLSVIWGYALSFFALGETLTWLQFVGGALILVSALSLSFDTSFHLRGFKWRFFSLMLLCTFVLALSLVIFKFFAVRDEYWSTTFWTYVGEATFGVFLLCIPSYFRQFTHLFRKNPGAVMGVNGANELINLGGGLGVRFALLLAPLALVQAINSTTTLFVFFFGVLLTFFLPRFGREDISARNLWQKGIAALLVAIGIVLMNA